MKKRRREAETQYTCPACYQQVDTSPDPGGGPQQEYVEDCTVCCRPNVISASWSEEEESWVIDARAEND